MVAASAAASVVLPRLPGAEGPAKEGHSGYDGRRHRFLEYCANAVVGHGYGSFWAQIGRLELGRPIDPTPFKVAIDFMKSRGDCSDFCAGGFIRILRLYGQNQKLPSELQERMTQALFEFKYWWDEPGIDNRSYDTENHQIIYHSCQLLAGEMFPDRVFTNSGRTGAQQVAFAQPMIERWLEWRVRFGFSEWLSNCYIEEDLMALTNLRDFAQSPVIRARAEMLIDLTLFDLALHSYRGTFGATHGRTYAQQIKGGHHEGSSTISWLVLGAGIQSKSDNMGALALATSSYRCPPVINAIADDHSRTILCRERQSLDVESAAAFGISTKTEEDLMLFRGMQDFTNYLTLDIAESLTKKYHLHGPGRYPIARAAYQKQIAAAGHVTDPWQCPNALGEVHIETLRGPDYMLSCAQDYRPGVGGYQQHIWQATFGADAVVFTNHPGSLEEGIKSRPNFWAGNGIKPRAAQHKNVLVCLHRIPAGDKYPFSHAYFPTEAFDEVTESGLWVFARKGDGYLALYSQNPTTWSSVASSSRNELRASVPENVWLCELGSRTENGSFERFKRAIQAAPVQCDPSSLRYASPSLGEVGFSWTGPLTVAGSEVPLHREMRFDNPYCQTPFQGRRVEIRNGSAGLLLDFDSNRREIVAPA